MSLPNCFCHETSLLQRTDKPWLFRLRYLVDTFMKNELSFQGKKFVANNKIWAFRRKLNFGKLKPPLWIWQLPNILEGFTGKMYGDITKSSFDIAQKNKAINQLFSKPLMHNCTKGCLVKRSTQSIVKINRFYKFWYWNQRLLLLPITQKDYKITFPSSHDIFV